MKKEKMSMDKLKSVLTHVLSREEMKQVLAGSDGGGGGTFCGKMCVANGAALLCYFNQFTVCTCPVPGHQC